VSLGGAPAPSVRVSRLFSGVSFSVASHQHRNLCLFGIRDVQPFAVAVGVLWKFTDKKMTGSASSLMLQISDGHARTAMYMGP
jgi:hypothetical protein